MKPATAGVLPDDPPRLGEVLDFMRLIWGLDHALQKTSKRMNRRVGVTGAQRLAIRLIARFPGIPAGSLAELLYVHPSTLTGILKRLERQGLIRRRPDPRDGRRAFLGITEKGRRIEASVEGTVEEAVAQVIKRVPKLRLDQAREVLGELTRALSETTDGAQ
jgi:MarR family transcriptional regulator, organic hydroperoxide resistance regulator